VLEYFGGYIITFIAIFVAFVIACVLNNKCNPQGHLPFKYGYFLSVFTIMENIALVVLLVSDIMDKPYYYSEEIFWDKIFIVFGTILLFGSSILNAKKYKIGAVFVSILTGNFMICIFYYKRRWNELKKIQKMKKLSLPNFFLTNEAKIKMKINSFNNKNYKDILIENGMSVYIQVFEKNKIDDLSIIVELTENDYEKMGIELMGDRKRLLKIFSKDGHIN
jgi:hypothetical protein